MNKARFTQQYGPWALVTGASSGLGADFARQLAAAGLNVVLVARNGQKLKEVAGEVEAAGVQALVIEADLSKESDLKKITAKTARLDVGLLINNAGFGRTNAFLDSLEDRLSEIDVHCRAPVILTHHFGNLMKERQRGGLVFIGSVLGYFPTTNMANYSATKGWNLLVGEGMYAELKPHGVDVLSVAPGATTTGFAETAGMNIAMAMKSSTVVRIALNTLGKRPAVIVGLRNKLNYYSVLPLGRRLAGKVYSFVMNAFMKH